MKSQLMILTLALTLLGFYGVLPSAAPALAQENSNSTQSSGSSGSQSTRSTTTTSTSTSSAPSQTSSQPTRVTVTDRGNTAGIDPIWLAVGAIGLVALLAIVILAMRGRGSNATVVRERTTVVKE